ncbi:sensor histidine kinase [Natranaeroarchaeum aerophilus]|uniref:histidine kinase n=1 Tax=Natranaeroarchaeum aerophilus TaxID=2917711 RepID=A0AAE3K6U9_9EURY|nr:HAMP domain-containing sensor histidine kinase [Natranaeroarchaeum aerophilus]MCL9813209.1 HAMP domain-containing histidine kinase [Natranaeroarchaeum aerophilus]
MGKDVSTTEDDTEQPADPLSPQERIEEVASVVSHDLQNPLTIANGYLSRARSHGDEEYFDHVEDALDEIRAISEEVVGLARLGQPVERTESVDFGTVVEACWSERSPEHGELVLESADPIQCDGNRLRSLLDRLFDNAIRHGGEDVTVTVGTTENGFFLADTGPGVTEGEHEAVLEAGYSTVQQRPGLGLTIVRAIAQAHGWSLSLSESEEGGLRVDISGADLITREALREDVRA